MMLLQVSKGCVNAAHSTPDAMLPAATECAAMKPGSGQRLKPGSRLPATAGKPQPRKSAGLSAAATALLGGLEDQRHGVGAPVQGDQRARQPDQHRGVPVVAAGVHFTRIC